MRARAWVLIGLLACGDEGGGDGGGGTDGPDTGTAGTTDTPPSTGDEVRVLVTAAGGGTVEAFGATLSIPPGALASDTEITVTVGSATGVPDEGSVLGGQVFDFGPDGTTFDPAATLTLPASGTPGAGESLVVSWLDGGAWSDLASTAGTGTVSAEVAHFTTFAARLVADAANPYACAPVAGCGGDVTGGWTADASCVMSAGEVPFTCEVGFMTDYQGDVGGYTFGSDGSYVLAGTGSGQSQNGHTVPAACIPSGATDCATLYADVPYAGFVCGGDVTQVCACMSDWTSPPWVGTGQGTWSATGTTLTLSYFAEQGYVDVDYEYCVSGNTLTTWDASGMVRAYTRAP